MLLIVNSPLPACGQKADSLRSRLWSSDAQRRIGVFGSADASKRRFPPLHPRPLAVPPPASRAYHSLQVRLLGRRSRRHASRSSVSSHRFIALQSFFRIFRHQRQSLVRGWTGNESFRERSSEPMISSLEVSTELIKRIIDHYSRIFHSYQAFVLRHMTSGEIKDTNQLFRSEFCLLIEMEDVVGGRMNE